MCREIQPWLMTARAVADLPEDIRDHVDKCGNCRRLLKLLKHVDKTIATLTIPPGRSGAVALLEERLGRVERDRSPIVNDRDGIQRRQVRRILLIGAAASLLVGLGWVLGRSTHALPQNVASPSAQMANREVKGTASASDKTLVARLLEHDVRLSQTVEPAEQVEILVRMADDLSDEALRGVRHGALNDVPLLVSLYGEVIRQGLLPKAASLPVDRKAAVLPDVIKRLQATEAHARVLERDALPIVVDRVRSIEATASEAQHALQTGRQFDQKALAQLPPNETPLLAMLVRQGLRLTATDDAFQRADLCADLAQPLAQNLVLVSVTGDDQSVAEIGQGLDELMSRGVADNLERVEGAAVSDRQRDEVKQVRERAAQVTSALESNFSRAPATAKPGLQRAMEASQNGRDRAAQGGKGKGKSGQTGPPRLRKDGNDPDSAPGKGNGFPGKGKGATPPGLQKKGSKDDSESKH